METDDREALTLDVVKKRFADSETALQSVIAELTTIKDKRHSAEAAAATLQESAAELKRLSETMQSMHPLLADTQRTVQEAAMSATGLLQGSDIRLLRESIESLVDKFGRSLVALEARLDRIESSVSDSARLHAQLDKVKNELPARWVKKLEL